MTAIISPWAVRMATLDSVRIDRPDVNTYELVFNDGPFLSQPGQFNMLYLPGIGEAAISIASDTPDRLLHTVKAVGNVTHALARLKPGDTIGVRGPFGTTWPTEQFHGCDLVIAAGGLGLPPLRPTILEVIRKRNEFGRVTLLYGARNPSELIYTAQYDDWRAEGIDVQISVDQPDASWTGNIGFLTVILGRLALDPGRTALFTCGPEIMMRGLAEVALPRGLKPDQIIVSLERNMSCGVGLCGHCQFGPEFICKTGPVLPYSRVRKLLVVEKL